MRYFYLILVGTLLSITPTQARLGDTTQKLLERFGKPAEQSPTGVGDLRQHVYFNNDLMITVLLTGDESIMEQYVRLKEPPKAGQPPTILPIAEELAQKILTANAEGSTWEPFESSADLRLFVRKDKKGFGSFSMNKGLITEVRISSKDMVDFAQKLRKP